MKGRAVTERTPPFVPSAGPLTETERVGHFDLTVACAGPSPEAAERWARRGEVLARWLVAEWEREHQGAGDE